ncbi:MORN motif family protein [Liquorilactobacillus sucicola DSM 21376 = JCM 15457]|nr:MORN motif family protein [Liquorilactobacillus sucicola DSM 21376 = JCM 15457]
MKKRTFFEVVVTLLLAGAAVFSLTLTSPKQEHYTLDHRRIVYDGRVVKNKFDGHGRLQLANHDRYVGHFAKGKFSGQGTFRSHEKWQYSGQFKEGAPDGSGVLTTADHHEYHGVFKKGVLLHAD